MESEILKAFAEYGIVGLVLLAASVLVWKLINANNKRLEKYDEVVQKMVSDLRTALDANTAAIKTLSETCMRNSILLDQVPRRNTEVRFRSEE